QMERGYQPESASAALVPQLFRPLMLLSAAINGLVGVALWLSPFAFAGSSAGAAPWWPWTLTPLTAGVVGGWYLAAAVLYLTMAQRQSSGAIRVALFGVMWATCLELLGALLHAGSFNGPALTAGLYLLNAAFIFGFAAFTFARAAPAVS